MESVQRFYRHASLSYKALHGTMDAKTYFLFMVFSPVMQMLFWGFLVRFIYDGKDLAGYASVGASGAIFGIIGAFGALVYYTRNSFPQLRQIILPIIVVSIIMTFLQSNINIAAHLGGLGAGFVLGLMYFNPKNVKLRRVK